MGRTCGAWPPNEIKKDTHQKNITALVTGHDAGDAVEEDGEDHVEGLLGVLLRVVGPELGPAR